MSLQVLLALYPTYLLAGNQRGPRQSC